MSMEELRRAATLLLDAKECAKLRMSDDYDKALNFGVVGLILDCLPFEFANGQIVLEEVVGPPGEVALASALKKSSLFGSVGRYSNAIRHQLRVFESEDCKPSLNAISGEEVDGRFSVAFWICSLLRVKTSAEFLVPLATNYSWSVIAGIEDNSCEVYFIEDVPHSKRFEKEKLIIREDLTWVDNYLVGFVDLINKNKSFAFAVECISVHQHQYSNRMIIANLWAGIEAIFQINGELTFRLSMYVAFLLEPPGDARLKLFKTMKKMYGFRSKAVHGGHLDEAQIVGHILEVKNILSKILCKIVENNKIYSEEMMEEIIFGCGL